MQITLNQEEIESALIAYVRSTISIADNFTVSVDLKAGRGEHGYAATLDITPVKEVVQLNTKMTGRAPKATTKSEPVVVEEKVLQVLGETLPEAFPTESPDSEQESATGEDDPAKTGSIFNFNG